ncbi:MAG: ABC-2 type transport system ATP-binding protein [Arenicella sp.]|jgi:ABC-2 type transport system ATP-binding protein
MSKKFVEIENLSKQYGRTTVLHDINLSIGAGEVVGLIGPNGAGKSTLLKAIMGLIKYSGKLSIFDKDPFRNRTELLENMSYIADVSSLPRWMKVKDLLEFVEKTHPKFDIARAKELLKDTPIKPNSRIETLSKGMKTRLHLVTILAINTNFLVLDEPTLGLDVLVRRDFQDRLVKDYYTQNRSILITTHQVDEIESILTRVVFIKEGRITLDIQISELRNRYSKLITNQNVVFSDPKLKPIYQRSLPEHSELIFKDVEASALAEYGQVVAPSLEDLFVAINA